MTCYWDSILSCLTREDHALIGLNHIPRREQFIEKLKEKNKLITALWQGKLLSKKEQEEHKIFFLRHKGVAAVAAAVAVPVLVPVPVAARGPAQTGGSGAGAARGPANADMASHIISAWWSAVP